jgi:hypothetical protein
MASLKVHILRCTSFRVAAAYEKVGITPRNSCALSLELFLTP